MLNIFLFGYNFSGIATYVRELSGWLIQQEGIFLNIVEIKPDPVGEFRVTEDERLRRFYIPLPEDKLNENKAYAQSCLDLLAPWTKDRENVIFHFNHQEQRELARVAKEQGFRLVYTLHFLPDFFSYVTSDFRYTHLTFSGEDREKEMIDWADRVICVTDFAQKVVVHYYRKEAAQVYRIYNGWGKPGDVIQVDKTIQEELKRKYGFAPSDRIILWVGRLTASKGVEQLMADFTALALDYDHIRLVLAGGGNVSALLKNVHSCYGNLVFTGKVSPEVIRDFYAIAEIGVIPSLFEQCSYVALEMMAHGLPLVVSDAPGLQELFRSGETALSFGLQRESGCLSLEEGQIGKAIACLLDNPELSRRLGQNARREWECRYRSERMAAETIEVYKSLLAT